MAIGRPIELTPNITSKNISVACTEGQTEFTVTGGYRINELSVYRNGVRLVDGRDFSATDGNTVTFISDTVVADDIVEFSVLDNFDIAGVIVGAASTQTLSGNLHITGDLYTGTFNPTNIVGSAITANSTLHVGSALTADSAGDVNTIGVITATAFYGDGSNLSNITSTTINNNADNRLISGSGTANTLNGESNLTFDGSTLGVTGAITASGAVNVDATTDSTSVTTGALIVDGGLGVAKNVYIGAGLSVAGTLTYEDVTSVDSVGMVTAKSGVNVSGGELNVGSGITMSATAGVVTFANGSATANNISLGNGKLKLYHNGEGNGYFVMDTGGAGNLYMRSSAGSDAIQISNNYTALGPGQKLLVNPGGVDVTNGYFKAGVSTVTSLTVTGDLFFDNGSDAGKDILWDVSEDALIFNDSTYLKMGSDGDCSFEHTGNAFLITNTTGNFFIRPKLSENGITLVPDGEVTIAYDNSTKLATTNDGVVVTGIMTASEGANYDGILSEKFETTAGKLSDNTNIDLADGMVHYFSTAESTTSTPNIRYNSSKSLNNMLSTGDAITVTIITTAAAAGYSANMTIDGSAQTEEWVGGSAPSEGGSDGLDILTFNILKTADATFKVIGNYVNATN